MDETTELFSHCIQLKNFAYEVATAQTKLENIYKNYGNLNFFLPLPEVVIYHVLYIITVDFYEFYSFL